MENGRSLQKHRPSIAFITSLDPRDRRAWSGTFYYMAKSLQEHVGDVHFFGPVELKSETILRLGWFIVKILSGRIYGYGHSPVLSKKYGKIFTEKISNCNYDLVFAPAASTEIAFLDTNIPLIYTSDATFSLMEGYCKGWERMLRRSVIEGNQIETRAIAKANLLVYPSQWAANSAINDYDADSRKVHVICYGANVDYVPALDLILHRRRKSNECKLLFLGADWERKGGIIALETLINLEKMGLRTSLTVCGCIPPKQFQHENMKVIPFLDKNADSEREKFIELMLDSDFLLLPTRSEPFGVVICEAHAFGLPIVTTDTGGIPVKNGIDGYSLPLSATGKEYAKIIFDLFHDAERYFNLIRAGREVYEKEQNWDAWGKSMASFVMELLSPKGSAVKTYL